MPSLVYKWSNSLGGIAMLIPTFSVDLFAITRRGKFELLGTARRTVYLWSALLTIKNAAMTV
jgi:hypothetical protein